MQIKYVKLINTHKSDDQTTVIWVTVIPSTNYYYSLVITM